VDDLVPAAAYSLAPSSAELSALLDTVFKRPDVLRFSRKVQFAPDPLKNAGFSRSILVIRDSWAMGNAGLSGSLVVARDSTNSRGVFGPAAEVTARR